MFISYGRPNVSYDDTYRFWMEVGFFYIEIDISTTHTERRRKHHE